MYLIKFKREAEPDEAKYRKFASADEVCQEILIVNLVKMTEIMFDFRKAGTSMGSTRVVLCTKDRLRLYEEHSGQ